MTEREGYVFTITVNKKELLDKVRENRDEHRAVFEKALEGYRQFVIDALNQRIERLKAGKTIEAYVQFAIPEDHTDDYHRVIGMLERHLGDDISLDEELYAQYVDNDWAWARNFAVSNAGYTQMAGTSYGKFTK